MVLDFLVSHFAEVRINAVVEQLATPSEAELGELVVNMHLRALYFHPKHFYESGFVILFPRQELILDGGCLLNFFLECHILRDVK